MIEKIGPRKGSLVPGGGLGLLAFSPFSKSLNLRVAENAEMAKYAGRGYKLGTGYFATANLRSPPCGHAAGRQHYTAVEIQA